MGDLEVLLCATELMERCTAGWGKTVSHVAAQVGFVGPLFGGQGYPTRPMKTRHFDHVFLQTEVLLSSLACSHTGILT